MSRQRWVDRRSVAIAALSVALWPACAGGVEPGEPSVIGSFRDFQAYLETATRVVRDLTFGITEARAQRSLTADERSALSRISRITEEFAGVLASQSRNTDFLMDYVIAARERDASEAALATRWGEARVRLTRTSQALADVVETARETPAFAAAVRDEDARQFYALARTRAGVMARIIELPRPKTAAELAALEATVGKWRDLISASQRLNEEIGSLSEQAS